MVDAGARLLNAMCGICGVVSEGTDGTALPAATAAAVLSAIEHRGPDAQGEFRDRGLWLGHTRLKILDLSDCGRQPMLTPDGRYAICYNGEAYNHRELAAELKLSGLRSRSDTEVVLRAFEHLGSALFERLNGIFALAIYDRERRKLWLARDRLGVKPLYYQHGSNTFVFGSEIKAIFAAIGEPPTCATEQLHEWLYYGTSLGGSTLYRGIRQLRPGHFLELDLETLTARTASFWTLPDEASEVDRRRPVGGLVAETRLRLEEAVRRQLMSDVAVGVFLSGGVDSSAVAAFAAKHYGRRITTYSAGFDDPALPDERPIARKTAARLGTDHHELDIAGSDVPWVIEKMVQHHDGPFADAANIPLFLMASQVRSTTKVVLQGDGGDEVFGGYRRHVTLRYHGLLHKLALAAGPVQSRLPRSAFQRRVSRYLRALAAPVISETMARLLTADDPYDAPAAVFSRDVRREIERADPFARYREVQREVASHDPANQMLLVDLMVELPDLFLEKVDRATMAAGVEARVPLLDNDLVAFAARIPGHIKVRHGRKKWLLKRALDGIVPADVLYGPKVGFNVPFGLWLRSSLKGFFHEQLESFDRRHPGVLDVAHVRAVHAQYCNGRHDRSFLLWKVLNLAVWGSKQNVRFVPAG
jgi:asparagine synthase (glutamine-hydrolysing)